MLFQQNIPLAELTTIRLGGTAQYFAVVKNIAQLEEVLAHADEHNLRTYILAGGSNTVFPDGEFRYLVIKIDMRGLVFREEGGRILATVAAGENWDAFVEQAVNKQYAGVECLSGIPGSVGATPMQNVGAYGQEVSETIVFVDAYDVERKQMVQFTNEECDFAYRTSRFKTRDSGRYIITSVAFRLVKFGEPAIRYAELAQKAGDEATLLGVRDAVIALRRKKSMVVDPNDPNSVSCGSFFTNPIMPHKAFEQVKKTWLEHEGEGDIPFFPEKNNMVKIPAGWLIEHAGFTKGYKKGNVAISDNHALALVNRGGTTKELLALAEEIKQGVNKTFGIVLAFEPNVVE